MEARIAVPRTSPEDAAARRGGNPPDAYRVALERAAFMQEVSRQLAGSLNVRRTVLRLLHLAVPYLGDWAVLALLDDRGATLAAHGGGVTEPVRVAELPDAWGGLGHLRAGGRTELLHVEPVVGPEGAEAGFVAMVPDAALRAEITALGPADLLGVALTARGGVLGALVVARRTVRGFTAADVELVEEFAHRGAVTIDAAALYEERAHVASVLQSALRPPSLPEVPGMRVAARFRPAIEHMTIGGDFYDLHGAGDDWSLVIGDVCGKGVRAAVLTGRARQTIRTAAHFDRSPATILAALNDVLYETDSDRFVTVACARLRPDPGAGTAELTLAVAGHPPPLVLRADGRVEEPHLVGTLSGVLPDLSYEERTVVLRRGDLVLFYTDGIFEARRCDDLFGLERLRALLPDYAGAEPAELCAAVEERVIEHLAGGAHDDMALLALRCG
ncbi:GAF domain-containing protein [Amycolatopsis arida]|uniref:GAF domain-containing protein n=1 Tax=Amycolatopsis arida TaxID=587909 RepID=A0A1I5L2F6_9PSEU|nr:SpoIIE family protein phosphatase [Amycolatopsis arida]TDX93559.1 GAF domain-containing protein [Amycolatopsis arida]SFO91520.1 GAF domain-containing protein [Amycolatopsis arida]